MEVVAITAAAIMAYGQIRQGYQQAEQMNYQASMYERQAGVEDQKAAAAEIEAQQEKEKGAFAIEEHRKKAAAILGEFVGKTAQRGVKLSGTPLDYLGSTAEDLSLEEKQIGYGADVAAWKMRREGAIHLEQSKVLNSEAGVYRKNASEAPIAGWIKGLGTMGLAAYNVYGKPAPTVSVGAEDSTSAAMSPSWRR